MKTILILTSALIMNCAYSAGQYCQNFSGKYEVIHCGSDGRNWPFQIGIVQADNILTIKQSECASMELKFNMIPAPEITPKKYVYQTTLNLTDAKVTNNAEGLNIKYSSSSAGFSECLPVPSVNVDNVSYNFSLRKDVLTIKKKVTSKGVFLVFPYSEKNEEVCELIKIK